MISPMVDAMDCRSRDAKEFISLLAAALKVFIVI